ncbi:MAG: acyl carrier protein [Sedimentisphaerales bacterium]|nr:acyl carrier protein [Sedimentisphaerales bacterium]
MNEQLQEIFKESFGLESLEDSMSIETVEGWDSMAHVGLMMALQQHFGVVITPAQAIELTDVASIKIFLKQQGKG